MFRESVNRGAVLTIAVLGAGLAGASAFVLTRAQMLNPQADNPATARAS